MSSSTIRCGEKSERLSSASETDSTGASSSNRRISASLPIARISRVRAAASSTKNSTSPVTRIAAGASGNFGTALSENAALGTRRSLTRGGNLAAQLQRNRIDIQPHTCVQMSSRRVDRKLRDRSVSEPELHGTPVRVTPIRAVEHTHLSAGVHGLRRARIDHEGRSDRTPDSRDSTRGLPSRLRKTPDPVAV